jgi:hypothetical protein
MRLSGWNQHWKHDEVVNLSPEQTYERLLRHYKQSSGSFVLDSENPPLAFSFRRGNVLVSALGLGSELWFRHHIEVNLQKLEGDKTQVLWDIDLKVFGLQAGSNAIIEECKRITKHIS